MQANLSRPNARRLAAWRAFLTAHARVTERLEHELTAERQLPLAWYDVLVQLGEAPAHRLRMHDLARAVLLSRAGLTRLVDRMTTAGLVQRTPCEEDRRGTYVAMTPRGHEALLSAAPIHLHGIEAHFAGLLSDEETQALEAMMRRIIDADASEAVPFNAH